MDAYPRYLPGLSIGAGVILGWIMLHFHLV